MIALSLGLGLCLGVVTGMPLGLVNVAIVEAASAGRVAHAARLGVGGAIADAIHAAVAFVGVGSVVAERVEWKIGGAIATSIVVASYAWRVWQRRKNEHEHEHDHDRSGLLVGMMLTLPNPAALTAWVAVAAVVWPSIDTARALVLAGGVGLGSALWFVALARFVSRRAVRVECSRSAG
ncbi:MAG: LysE family transporter [Acidobacteriota bacterium]